MVPLEPFAEYPGVVDAELHLVMSEKVLKQRQVGMGVCVFEYLMEIPGRLVIMYLERNPHHNSPATFLTTSIAAELGSCLPMTLIPR